MKTYFAPAELASDAELHRKVKTVTENPIIAALMNVVNGLVMVMNEQRQILSVNEEFLEFMGVDKAEDVLGLRIGEAIKCTYSDSEKFDCGTTKFCSSCGTAVAIAATFDDAKPVARMCSVTVEKGNKKEDLFFSVKSYQIILDKERFILLFLHDKTEQQRLAAMERTFFHDINNIITGLLATSHVAKLMDTEAIKVQMNRIYNMSLRLSKEIKIYKYLSLEKVEYKLDVEIIFLTAVFTEIKSLFSNHPVVKNKHLQLPDKISNISFSSDLSIMMRVLNNMIINAFEATKEGGEVKVSYEYENDFVKFNVWNKEQIPANVEKRVFQRNFSTKQKSGSGRGIGAYSMKLFGEELLGGKVSFITSEAEGTVFSFKVYGVVTKL